MDPQRFGAFLAQLRKEKNMTQAELARHLQVTDKAVSRWERGLGFPDIHTLEPLAQTLGITVVELMQSRKQETMVSKEEASQALTDTVEVAHRQWCRWLKKVAVSAFCFFAIIVAWCIATGMMTRSDVYIYDYSVMEDANVLTVKVGVAGSMGYLRHCRVLSEADGQVQLRFYAAFGGLISKWGAKNMFVIPLSADTEQIILENGRIILEKNEQTGQWERPKQ